MSWYLGRMNASAFGHSMLGYTGTNGTYFDHRNAECMKAVADYRTKHLKAVGPDSEDEITKLAGEW